MELLKLVPFDFIQPSKLLLGLGPNEYVAVDEKGMVLGRGRNKEAILATPGATGYFNLKEMAPLDDAKDGPPPFEKAPWGSLGPVQNIPGQPLIEPIKVNRPDLIVVDEASKVTKEQYEAMVAPIRTAKTKKTKKAK
jgi:hypothetical protein